MKNTEYYSNVLYRLMDEMKEKRREKLRNDVLFLQDNAFAHSTLDDLKKLVF